MEPNRSVLLIYFLLLFIKIEGDTYWCEYQDTIFIVLGLSWLKIFSHDTAGGMFPHGATNPDRGEVKNFNDDDPDAYLFSILYRLEEFRVDGIFHLKLCYPEYEEEFPCNEWSQRSNFVEEREIVDYKPIRISYLDKGWGRGDFPGLMKMVGWAQSYFLYSPYSWFFGIGYGYMPSGKSFEGAAGKPNVAKLELYVMAGNTKQKLHVT